MNNLEEHVNFLRVEHGEGFDVVQGKVPEHVGHEQELVLHRHCIGI